MKCVYSSNKQLVEAWAKHCKDADHFGAYKRASSVSCQYDRLFSYRTCIAELVNDSTAILNSYHYSQSTSKHQGLASFNTWGIDRIFLEFPKYNLNTLIFSQHDFDEFVKPANESIAKQYIEKAKRARKHGETYLNNAKLIIGELKRYASLLKLNYSPLDIK